MTQSHSNNSRLFRLSALAKARRTVSLGISAIIVRRRKSSEGVKETGAQIVSRVMKLQTRLLPWDLFAVLSALFLSVFNYPFGFRYQLFFLPVNFWTGIFGFEGNMRFIWAFWPLYVCRMARHYTHKPMGAICDNFLWVFPLWFEPIIHSRHQVMIGQNNAIRRQPRTEKAKQMLPSSVLSLVIGACYLACLVLLFPQIDDAYGILGLEFLTALLYCVLSMKLLKTSIQDTELGLARNIAFGVFAGFCFAITTYAYYYIEDVISPLSLPFPFLTIFYDYAVRYLPILTGVAFIIACVFTFDSLPKRKES